MPNSKRELHEAGHDAVRDEDEEAGSQAAVDIEEARVGISGYLHDEVRELRRICWARQALGDNPCAIEFSADNH